MKKLLLFILILSLAIGFCFAVLYYAFLQIDFVGYKDPNLKLWNNTLLSAKYRQGTNYCEVDLIDSTTMEINVGNMSGGVFLSAAYKIMGDTIVNADGIKHITNYINSDKFLIDNDKLLYRVDDTGKFDTTIAMTIHLNKLKR